MSTLGPEEINPFQNKKEASNNNSVMAKVSVIVLLILGMLIPLWMISKVISERQDRKNEVSREIEKAWGGSQTLLGPILVLPYKTECLDPQTNKLTQSSLQLAYLLPRRYSVNVNLKSGVRYRGIYKSVVYTNFLNAQGEFNIDDLKEFNIGADNIIWKDAYLELNVSPKSIQETPVLQCNGKTLEIRPNTHRITLASLSASYPNKPEAHTMPFSLKLVLNGSESFNIVPIGKENKFQISSDWSNPSFTGSTLPRTRNISAKGFEATWEVPCFVRNLPQVFKDNTSNMIDRLTDSQIGVSLLHPIDSYRESDRAVKYAILFLVLTFSVYFLFEILCKLRLHPFQYFLIGCALCLFYLLLISFSEVIEFNWAYSVASIATISIITLYSKAILGKGREGLTLIIGGLLSSLYIYLYVLLQLEDLSLVCGTLGLLIFLVVIMYLTRNIDWYKDQLEMAKS